MHLKGKMISLKAVQTSFLPTQQAFFHDRRPVIPKTWSLRFSKLRNGSHPDGDIRKQELLAAILTLEAQKVRVANYVDERAAYLTRTTEETTAEMNEIGVAAIKELNESSSKMMEEMESKMQAYEESANECRREIQENEKKLADFESQIALEQNDKASSKLRQNIYLAIMGLLVIVISFISVPSPN